MIVIAQFLCFIAMPTEGLLVSLSFCSNLVVYLFDTELDKMSFCDCENMLIDCLNSDYRRFESELCSLKCFFLLF